MSYIGKTVLTGAEARKEVLAGAKFLGDCVTPTIGPFGTNALLEKGLKITNDGVSVANEIQLDNEIQDLGLRKTRQAAQKANDQVGDGSTTCVTLTVETATEMSSKLGDGKVVGAKSTASLLKQLHKEKDEVVEKLHEMATPITTEEQLIRSAVVSVEDEELGELIGKTQFELGPQGYLIPEETLETRTTVERVLGIRVDNGLGMTQAINNPEKGSLDLTDVPVILTSNTVVRLEPLMHIFEGLAERGQREVVLVARAVSEDCIREIQANAQQKFFIYPVNAPYVNQREVMKDLEAVLGGRFVDHEDGGLDTIQYSDLGHIKLASIKRYDGIFSGESTEEAKTRVAKRVEHLKTQLEGTLSDFDRRSTEARVAQLTNGFAIVKVGAPSETERKRIFDKVEDAVHAVRAAYQEGTVPGAGLAFKQIADEMPADSLLKKPLGSIYRQVMKNAPEGFVIEDWVRDPVKVLRIALEQACIVAGDLATVSVAVHTKRKKSTDKDED